MTEMSMPIVDTGNEGAPKGTVAYLGPKASFTHQATLKDFPEGSGYAYRSCATIKDIVTTVAAREADYGVVPFENSTYGPVVDTLDLLAASPTAYPSLQAIAESYIDVHHALVGRKPPNAAPVSDTSGRPATNKYPDAASSSSLQSGTGTVTGTGMNLDPTSAAPGLGPANASFFSSAAAIATRSLTPNSSGAATPTLEEPRPARPRSKPKVSLSHIKTVFSHPQGFGQCAAFLAAYLRHAERHETSSTAAAAARVAAHDGIDQAAITSIAAGEARGLDVLAEQIEDLEGNRTRFLTLSLRVDGDKDARGGSRGASSKDEATPAEDKTQRKKKTLISFRLRPGAPAGALASALAAFTDQGLDLTSIHPRPSGLRAWDYVFVVECVGGPDEAADERAVHEALRVLAERVERCFLHGRYWDRGAE